MYADYNFITSPDNIVYTVDMLRLRTNMTYSDFTKIEFRLKTLYKHQIKKEYMSSSLSQFKYNYNIEIVEGQSYWFGFMHNSELTNNSKSMQNEKTEYNFTVEFNPNKLPLSGLLKYILNMTSNWIIKQLDIAMDIRVNILDLCRYR
ncbi:MAG: hypothetical protein ACLU8F_02955 [Clostridia bacterium]